MKVPVQRIAMELPLDSSRTSWAYLLPDSTGRLHLIDCGGDTPANRAALAAALDARGRSVADIASVTATHAHVDHLGLAGHLREVAGTRIAVHLLEAEVIRSHRSYGGDDFAERLDRWGVPASRRPDLLETAARPVARGGPVPIDRLLDHQDRLDIPGWDLFVVATPGHTPGSICLFDAGSGTAFVGDHVLPDQHPGVGLGGPVSGNPVDDFLGSLTRLDELHPTTLLPGHGEEITEPAARIAAQRAHVLRRRAQVVEASRAGGSVWQVASRLTWSGGWPALSGIRLFSALQQVELHRRAVAGVR